MSILGDLGHLLKFSLSSFVVPGSAPIEIGEFLIRCARSPKGTPKGPKKKKKKKIKIDNGHIKTPKFSMLYCSFGYFLLGIKYK